MRPMFVQLSGHAVRYRAERAQQKWIHSLTDGAKVSFERFMSNRTVATVAKRLEHRGRSLFEIADMRGSTRHLADVTAACRHCEMRSTKRTRQQFSRA